MNSAGDAMICERYHARISAATCLARRKLATSKEGGARWSRGHKICDPYCSNCQQGEEVAARHGGTAHRPATPEPPPGKKACKRCGEAKPLDEFYILPAAKDNHDSSCKRCRNAYNAERKQIKAAAPKVTRRVLGIVQDPDAHDREQKLTVTLDVKVDTERIQRALQAFMDTLHRSIIVTPTTRRHP